MLSKKNPTVPSIAQWDFVVKLFLAFQKILVGPVFDITWSFWILAINVRFQLAAKAVVF